MHAVVKRSNSRNCGTMSALVVTNASGHLLAHDRRRAPLVLRVQVREQEADRDRLDARLAQLARRGAHLVLVERHERPRRVGGTIRSVTTLRWRRCTNGRACHGMSCMHRVVLRPLVAADVHDVAEAARRDHARRRAACSSTAFVAIVVPWKTWSSAAIGTPAVRQISPTPRMNARDGSSGVLATLCVSVTVRLGVREHDVRERSPDIDADQAHGGLVLCLIHESGVNFILLRTGPGSQYACHHGRFMQGSHAAVSATRPLERLDVQQRVDPITGARHPGRAGEHRDRDGPQAHAHELFEHHPRVRGFRRGADRRRGRQLCECKMSTPLQSGPIPGYVRGIRKRLRSARRRVPSRRRDHAQRSVWRRVARPRRRRSACRCSTRSELIGFSVTTAHHLDIGAHTPGSCGIVDRGRRLCRGTAVQGDQGRSIRAGATSRSGT